MRPADESNHTTEKKGLTYPQVRDKTCLRGAREGDSGLGSLVVALFSRGEGGGCRPEWLYAPIRPWSTIGTLRGLSDELYRCLFWRVFLESHWGETELGEAIIWSEVAASLAGAGVTPSSRGGVRFGMITHMKIGGV